jgi:malonate decarboxylase delta subunit
MERLHFEYPASQPIKQRAHVGVVGSGDLEVLLEPSSDQKAHVTVITSVGGFGKTWKLVMDRFFSRYQYAASLEIQCQNHLCFFRCHTAIKCYCAVSFQLAHFGPICVHVVVLFTRNTWQTIGTRRL